MAGKNDGSGSIVSLSVAPSQVVTDPPPSRTTGRVTTKRPTTRSWTQNTKIKPTDPAAAIGSLTVPKTTGQSDVSVYSSYGDETSTTDLFPMQHATEQLPTNAVPLSQTDYITSVSQQTDSTEPQALSSSTDPSSSQPASTSTESSTLSNTVDSDIPSSSTAMTDISGVQPSSQSSSSSLTAAASKTSDNTAQPSSQPDSQVTSATPHSTGHSKLTTTSDYIPTTGEVVTPLTVSRTSILSSAIALDTVSVKTTSAVPLTPPNMKPVSPASTQGTSLLGGGLSDYIVYIGAPLCGAGILILLIVCILCLRKRKAKSKGSPAKSQVQDLWVNSQPEIPLSNRSPLLEARGGDRHIQDLADSNLRRRKPDKPKAVLVDTIARHSTGNGEDINDVSTNATAADNNNLEDCGSGFEGSEAASVKPTTEQDVKEELEVKTKEVVDGCNTYEAVFDFRAEQDTHLSLQQGDLVKVTRKEDNGWWRGTVDNRIGWFPSNYVQPALQADKLETENEVEMHNESHLSSFLVKKNLEPSPRNSMGSSQRNSYPTEEEIEAEPIYCKIQPKEKRKSTPKVPEKIMPPHQLKNRENTPIPIEEGVKFKVIYPYDGHFNGELHLKTGDIIAGKEQDRNGWMNGYNEMTGEDGWFPAVYVQKIPKVEPKSESPSQLDTDPASYKELEANTRLDGKEDLVGIVHKAVHNFEAEKAGDLEFEDGDLITVFQVLENGWWLGCKDKTVGWFPGSFVKVHYPQTEAPDETMIDQPSNGSGKNTPSPDRKVSPAVVGTSETTPKKSKLRPVRKAPPPPTVDKHTESKIPSPISKIPKKAGPMRTAPPAPPTVPSNTGIGNDSVDRVKNIDNTDTNFERKVESVTPLHDGLYDVLDLPEERMNNSKSEKTEKVKPDPPKRYIKPKVVTIPRSQVNMSSDTGLHLSERQSDNQRSRPPPPPRPNLPKLGPIRAKLQAPKSPGHQSQSEEEDNSFFNLTNQFNIDEFLRQDSSELDVDTNPYSLSSFGSTFGKKEDVKNSPNNHISKSPVLQDTADRSSFGSSFGKTKEANKDTHTLDDTSPIVFNDKRDTLQNQSFVINSHDKVNDENEFKFDESSVTPMQHDKIANTREEFPEKSPATAEIPVTPTSPKKKEKVSRLAPPKPVTLSLESTTDQGDVNKVKSQDSSQSSTSSAGLSRIPRSAGSGEPVSRLPVSRKDTPVKSEETKQTPVVPKTQSPIADKNQNIKVSDNSISVKKDEDGESVNAMSVSPHMKYREEMIDADISSDSESRVRTDSFGVDKPPVAPKPKPKGLPKLLPKPKAGLKPTARDGENDNESVKESDSSPVSSLPSTPVAKHEFEVPDVELKPKEEEPKPTKIPLGSKIAQKSPQLRGRKSGIPASPGMRNKSRDRLDDVQSARKTSESEDTPSRGRYISESDSDAPLSPVSNIRRKPESPSGARRVKKGESHLRNRSNSPHGRTGIPVNLKQRSNSPASKIPRTGIPKANTGSPLSTPTSNGSPSGLVQPKPIALDQDLTSPKSGPKSPRTEANSSPEAVESPSTDNTKVKPDRPSKPPQVQKQKSQDGKPKHGKSLLPLIHKNMDASQNGISPSPGSKPKRGIPVAKPPRPPAPKSPTETGEKNEAHKRTLYQAVKGYTARSEEELSFTEGTFIKELSDCDRPGWYVGMLADGTTGLYPSSYFKPSPVSAQSEA